MAQTYTKFDKGEILRAVKEWKAYFEKGDLLIVVGEWMVGASVGGAYVVPVGLQHWPSHPGGFHDEYFESTGMRCEGWDDGDDV